MTEYCKHGLKMDIPCRKCGRTSVAVVPNFEALKNGFTSSIDNLEETVRRMQAELARPVQRPEAVEPPAARAEPDAEAPYESPPPPPPSPPERFPWQRS